MQIFAKMLANSGILSCIPNTAIYTLAAPKNKKILRIFVSVGRDF